VRNCIRQAEFERKSIILIISSILFVFFSSETSLERISACILFSSGRPTNGDTKMDISSVLFIYTYTFRE